jgi:hypothetical protein
MEFTKDTMVKDILAAYPGLKEKLIKADPRFEILANPLAAALINRSTLADVSAKAGMDVDSLIAQLKSFI